MKKLSEKFLDRVSHSTEFSKPVVLTKHVQRYGEICKLEEALELYKFLYGLGGHHYSVPTLRLILDKIKVLEKELKKIEAKEKL
jgi:hypothetical protein